MFVFWVPYVFVFPLGSAQRLGIYSRKIRHIYLHIVGGCLPFVEIVALSAGRQNDWGVSGHSLLKSHSSAIHSQFDARAFYASIQYLLYI